MGFAQQCEWILDVQQVEDQCMTLGAIAKTSFALHEIPKFGPDIRNLAGVRPLPHQNSPSLDRCRAPSRGLVFDSLLAG